MEVTEGDLPMLLDRRASRLDMMNDAEGGKVCMKHLKKLLHLSTSARGHLLLLLSDDSKYMQEVMEATEKEVRERKTSEQDKARRELLKQIFDLKGNSQEHRSLFRGVEGSTPKSPF